MQTRKLLSISLVACTLAGTIYGTAAVAQSSDPAMRPMRKMDPDSYYKAPSGLHGKTVILPIGTTFSGRIDHTISSERSHNGERFVLVIDNPVLVNGNDVVIPTGSQIIGEVVEAVPAAAVPREPGQPKIAVRGKLRITVSGLKTPDGSTYPLVATIQGEVQDKRYGINPERTPIGTSVGYTGSAGSFEAVNANRAAMMKQRQYGNYAPAVLGKRDFLRDEVMGVGPDAWRENNDHSTVRSLVLRKRDYFIFADSPLTLKVTSPFKIGIATPGLGASVGSVEPEPQDTSLPPPSREDGGGGRFGGGGGGRFRSDNGGAPPQGSPAPSGGGMPSDGF